MRSIVLIAGNGKLAKKLISDLPQVDRALSLTVDSWDNRQQYRAFDDIAVVHVGSGRQLPEAAAYCREHAVPLLQGSTGVEYHPEKVEFPLVIAPNFSVLMIKFLSMLKEYGRYFQGYDITLGERLSSGEAVDTGNRRRNRAGCRTGSERHHQCA